MLRTIWMVNIDGNYKHNVKFEREGSIQPKSKVNARRCRSECEHGLVLNYLIMIVHE